MYNKINSEIYTIIIQLIREFEKTHDKQHWLLGNFLYWIKDKQTELLKTENCPDDCEHKMGRFCLITTNHCIRKAEDHYSPRK